MADNIGDIIHFCVGERKELLQLFQVMVFGNIRSINLNMTKLQWGYGKKSYAENKLFKISTARLFVKVRHEG